MGREFDTHFCAVTYRTARMATRHAAELRSCGWRVLQGYTDDPRVLHVFTYKPRILFGHEDLRVTTNPEREGETNYWINRNWRVGIVGWELACACDASRLETDYRLAGTRAHLQPVGKDGGIFWPSADYVIERVEWSCMDRESRANVCVRTPEEDGWRGRMIMVEEAVLRELAEIGAKA